MLPWKFEKGGEVVRITPAWPLIVQIGSTVDLVVDSTVAGTGLGYLFEAWWPRFSGPFLYYPGRRLPPAPLRAFIDFIRAQAAPR